MSIQISGKTGESVASDESFDEAGASEAPDNSFVPGKIGGNILSLGTGEILARVAAFVGTTFAARQLGPEQFGIVGFALAIFSYFSIAVSGGFNDIGSREVARRPREASSIAASVIAVRLVIAFLALIAIALTAWFLNKPPQVKLILYLTGLLFFTLAFDVSWVYKGLERNRLVAVALIASQIVYASFILLTVRHPDDVEFVPLAQFTGEILAAVILLGPLLYLGKIEFDLREGFRLLRSSGFWAVSRLMRALMYGFDVVLIGLLLGEGEVGLYTAPYRICFLLVAVAVAIHASYLPSIIRAAGGENANTETGKMAERSLYFAAAVAAPLVVGGIIIARPLLVAVFGNDYAAGSGAFQFLILSIGFVFLFGAVHNIFLAVNRLKTEMLIFAAAATVNIALNIWIVPRYGITGAGMVTAFAEGLTLVAGLIMVNRIGVPLSIRPIWRPILASAVMGASLIALGPNRVLVWYLSIGCISYLLALVVLRGIPRDALPHFQLPIFH